MKINIDCLIEIIVKEVIEELSRIGVDIEFSNKEKQKRFNENTNMQKQKIDMSGYKTPVLTENILELINKDVNEIIIPKGTVFTPGARDIIKKRNFIISYN